MAKDDFKLLERIFVGKMTSVNRPGVYTKEDMEAYKYTFQQFGKLVGHLQTLCSKSRANSRNPL